MTTQIDEETPLLQENNGKKRPTPLPWSQFSLVLVLQLAEPLSLQVIYPFAPQLIRDVGVTNGDESRVGYYVGLMQSLFSVTQAFTVLHWSRMSDRIGRKPVILIGLLGSALSIRGLSGALNGNVGIIKSMIAEMTDSTNISQAYAYMPIAWSTGGALGPLIGGMLSRPVDRFPRLFGHEFLKKYPYFLPCAVPATFSVIVSVVTVLSLKETVNSPITIKEFLGFKKEKGELTAHQPEMPEGAPTARSIEGPPEAEKPLPLRALLTRRVIIAAGNYASLSLVDISFRAIQPLFLSTPIHLGGLGLQPSTIGTLLAIYGVLNGVFQLLFFAQMNDRWGSKRVFFCGIASAIPAFALFPVINYLARHQGYSTAVWIAVGFQIALSIVLCLSFGAVFIFIANASPNRASLGATNGLSQVSVSIMRALGPAAANSLFSISMAKGYLGGYLVYYILILVVCVSLVIASMLPRHV